MKKEESISVEVVEFSPKTTKEKKKGKLRSLPTKAKIGYSCLIVGFLAIGALGGLYLSKILLVPEEIYEFGDEDNIEEILGKYKKLDPTSDLTSSLKSYEFVNLAAYNHQQEKYAYSQQFGYVDAGVASTDIRVTNIKNDKNYFTENLSYCDSKAFGNFAKAGRRFYQSEIEVQNYNGPNVEKDGNIYKSSWSLEETKTIDEHSEKWGKDLSRPLIYNISSSTVLDGSTCELKNEMYLITMDLNPKNSGGRYKAQMNSISGVTNVQFKNIHIVFNITKDLHFKSVAVTETYSVRKIGIDTDSTGTLNEYFIYGEERKIPEINENFTYNEEEFLWKS